MSNRTRASQYYKYFSLLPGNQHIASLYAIEKILEIVQLNKPKRILEVGLGIGSISYSIIHYLTEKGHDFEYFGTENNEYCLEQLPQNLMTYFPRIELFESLAKIDSGIAFDFVILDGIDNSLHIIQRILKTNGLIFIEGDRNWQKKILLEYFPEAKVVHIISNCREPEYSPFTTGNWSGGGWLIYTKPTYKQYFQWVKNKCLTAYRYRVLRGKW